ncbi:hypothetical protein KIH31_08280 [Paenarthrobacter sp. DKR-5]|uniref:hypothetical protein n=1 Tax=Paenarthrobacter sp. DKR-5 TaxID=2835535 RepID=UPI001BDBE029|nr:hypothetical protein [Paenarthrobacter sp. DKR-5]MBT1002599.1 hypothetical protein [Paenarthrobacter sp. DKR-5]
MNLLSAEDLLRLDGQHRAELTAALAAGAAQEARFRAAASRARSTGSAIRAAAAVVFRPGRRVAQRRRAAARPRLDACGAACA